MTIQSFTVGAHNTHDDAGHPTAFASVIGFTEAIPKNVRKALEKDGYKFVNPIRQRDLMLAYKPSVVRKVGLARYKFVHAGIPKVTPHRGTLKVTFKVLATGELVDVYLEHRINAAFAPFRRGEAKFRETKWDKHTRVTCRMIGHSIAAGRSVLAMGDLNTPTGVKGYKGLLTEYGQHFDRIGVKGLAVESGLVLLSKEGSDHPRLKLTVTSRGER